jgi:hypothetical protein
MAYPPLELAEPTRIVALAEGLPADGQLRLQAEGETLDGDFVSKVVMLPIGAAGAGAERLAEAGIEVRIEEGEVLVDNLVFGSAAEKAGLDFDWKILGVEVAADRPPKQLMFFPALILLGLIILLQRGRRRAAAPAPA